MLSTFIIVLFFLFLGVNLGYFIFVPDYELPPADLIGYGFLVTTYILSRTRFPTVAAILVMTMFPMNIFGNLIGGTSINPSVTLVYLLPSFVLSSMWFSVKGVVSYCLLTLSGIISLPYLAPASISSFSDIIGAFSVSVVGSVLVVVAMIHRNLMESDRQNELETAYDTTLEGWAHALELRDRGTEGHSQRVINLVIQLARKIGVQEKDIVHVRRGALLHDIGKMGVPDSILLTHVTQ